MTTWDLHFGMATGYHSGGTDDGKPEELGYRMESDGLLGWLLLALVYRCDIMWMEPA